MADLPALSVHELAQGYGTRQLFTGLSFELPRGALCTLLGPNGIGKSSLLRLVAGTAKPAGDHLWFLALGLEGGDQTSRAVSVRWRVSGPVLSHSSWLIKMRCP